MRRAFALIFLGGVCLAACQSSSSEPMAPEPAPPLAPQTSFKTPEAAMEALKTAFRDDDDEAIVALFGTNYRDLSEASGRREVSEFRQMVYDAAEESTTIEKTDDGRITFVLGRNDWPMPVPLVRENQAWRFDGVAGREEIRNRIIGENELTIIDLCRTYVIAQAEYAALDRDGDGVLEYAQRVMSTPGQQDGLHWAAEGNDALSPLGRLAANAEGATAGEPFFGYRFAILKRQGRNAPGGAHGYVINGNMIAGCALVAWPAEYGKAGIMVFLISHHGRLYQKDLGERTASVASAMRMFDPDGTWQVVED